MSEELTENTKEIKRYGHGAFPMRHRIIDNFRDDCYMLDVELTEDFGPYKKGERFIQISIDTLNGGWTDRKGEFRGGLTTYRVVEEESDSENETIICEEFEYGIVLKELKKSEKYTRKRIE